MGLRRAQSQRGKFGESWWESFDLGARLTRGRRYARAGQVLSIAVKPGVVSAEAQGSRLDPYEIRIAVKPLSKANWRKFAGVVSSQAISGAKLLGGEMRDPFLIFQLRGMGREEFLDLLRESALTAAALTEESPAEPLPASAASFWTGYALPEHLPGGADVNPPGAALPRRLGKFPFWRGRENFLDGLEVIYRSAAHAAAKKISEG